MSSKVQTGIRLDLEDAALIACAEANLCDVILTSNTTHFKPFTKIIVNSPEEFVRIVKEH